MKRHTKILVSVSHLSALQRHVALVADHVITGYAVCAAPWHQPDPAAPPAMAVVNIRQSVPQRLNESTTP